MDSNLIGGSCKHREFFTCYYCKNDKLSADNKALREELVALKQSIPKIRADAILKVLDTPHDCETPNGDIAWSSGSLELIAEFQLNKNKIEVN